MSWCCVFLFSHISIQWLIKQTTAWSCKVGWIECVKYWGERLMKEHVKRVSGGFLMDSFPNMLIDDWSFSLFSFPFSYCELFCIKSIFNTGLFSYLHIKISSTASTHSWDFLWLVNIWMKPKSIWHLSVQYKDRDGVQAWTCSKLSNARLLSCH